MRHVRPNTFAPDPRNLEGAQGEGLSFSESGRWMRRHGRRHYHSMRPCSGDICYPLGKRPPAAPALLDRGRADGNRCPGPCAARPAMPCRLLSAPASHTRLESVCSPISEGFLSYWVVGSALCHARWMYKKTSPKICECSAPRCCASVRSWA